MDTALRPFWGRWWLSDKRSGQPDDGAAQRALRYTSPSARHYRSPSGLNADNPAYRARIPKCSPRPYTVMVAYAVPVIINSSSTTCS